MTSSEHNDDATPPPSADTNSSVLRSEWLRNHLLSPLFLRMRNGPLVWSLVAAALVSTLLFIYFVLWSDYRRPNAGDISRAWFEQIGRFGIIARFPPEEDFYVGDIYAVISSGSADPFEEAANGDRGEDSPISLEGRSIRVGHIDLRSEITENNLRPVFPDTKLQNNGRPEASQDRTEAKQHPSEMISLTRVAFPTIILNRGFDANAGFSLFYGAMSGGGQDTILEEVSIPNAETYGASVISALANLRLWCADEETKIYCSDVLLRRALSFSISPRVNDVDDAGSYKYRIKLMIVSRVYITREIKVRRLINGDRGLDLSTNRSSDSEGEAVVSGVTLSESEGESADILQVLEERARASGQLPSADTSAVVAAFASREDVGLDAVFPRPMVFGYKAVTVDIPPVTPGVQ